MSDSYKCTTLYHVINSIYFQISQIICTPKISKTNLTQIFFGQNDFLTKNFLWSKFVLTKYFFDQKSFFTQNFQGGGGWEGTVWVGALIM